MQPFVLLGTCLLMIQRKNLSTVLLSAQGMQEHQTRDPMRLAIPELNVFPYVLIMNIGIFKIRIYL